MSSSASDDEDAGDTNPPTRSSSRSGGHSLSMGAHGPPLTPTKTMSKLKNIQSMKDSDYIDSPMAKAATMLVMEESFPGFKTQLHAIRPGGGRARESEVTTLNPLSLLRGVPNIFSPC